MPHDKRQFLSLCANHVADSLVSPSKDFNQNKRQFDIARFPNCQEITRTVTLMRNLDEKVQQMYVQLLWCY